MFKRRKKSHRDWEGVSERHADGIRGLITTLGLILLVLVAFAGSLLVLQPRKTRDELLNELQEAKKQLEKAKELEEKARERFLWMQDPEYLEQLARDVAQRAYPEERVIQLPRGEEREQELQEGVGED